MSNRTPLPITSSPRKPCRRASAMACSNRTPGPRVLAPEVHVAPLATGGEGGDGHGLDHRERVTLHDHAVLERPRLGLVRVAHEVVGPHGLAGHRVPLPPGREGRPAPPLELGVGDLPDHPGRAQVQGPAQRGVPTMGAVVGQAGGIDAADAAQQHQGRVAPLRDRLLGRRLPGSRPAPDAAPDDRRRPRRPRQPRVAGASTSTRGGAPASTTMAAGARSHTPRQGERCQVALPSSVGAPSGPSAATTDPAPCAMQARSTQTCTTRRRPGRRGQQGVEGEHAVDLGRRHGQPLGDVVQRALAHPADAVVHGVQRGQELRPELVRGRPPAEGHVAVVRHLAPHRPSRTRAGRAARRRPLARPPSAGRRGSAGPSGASTGRPRPATRPSPPAPRRP